MGITKIFIGFIFIANPCINLLDFLPDFIGFLLIRNGLFQFDYIDTHMSQARDAFHKLYLLGLAKFVLMFAIPSSDANTRLLISFGCCVGEVLLVISAVPKLFDGFTALATRFHGQNVFKHYSSARFLVFVVLIVKNVLILFPDLFTIFILDAEMKYIGGSGALQYQLRLAKSLSLPITLIATAVFGIYTAVHFYLFLRDFSKDKPLMNNLREKFKEIFVDNENLQARRAMRIFSQYYMYAFLCFINFYVDGYSIIPDFFGLLFILLSLFNLKKLIPVEKKEIWIMSICTVFSATAWGYRLYSALQYKAKFADVFHTLPLTFPLGVLACLLPFFCYYFILKRLRILCCLYTRYTFEPESRFIYIGLSVYALSSLVQYALPVLDLPWGWIAFAYTVFFIFKANSTMHDVYKEARLKLLI